METIRKLTAAQNPEIILKVVPGHFVTANSHVNYYVDISLMKARQSQAQMIASEMARDYYASTVIDTIVCMDGCEVIGAYLATELTKNGIVSMNEHKSIYIVTPEFIHGGQVIFRENIIPMIKGKHILLILGTATTGKTIASVVESIKYYDGVLEGISSIFSTVKKVYDMPVRTIFDLKDLPDYQIFTPDNCRMCKEKVPVDALVNGFGYSRIY